MVLLTQRISRTPDSDCHAACLIMTDFIKSRSTRYAAMGLFFAVVSWGLLSPSSPLKALSIFTPMNDLLVHCGTFGIAAFTCAAMFDQGSARRRMLICVALLLYGAGTELAQAWIPFRTCSASDLFANVTGVAAGMVASIRLRSLPPMLVGSLSHKR